MLTESMLVTENVSSKGRVGVFGAQAFGRSMSCVSLGMTLQSSQRAEKGYLLMTHPLPLEHCHMAGVQSVR